MKKIHFHDFEFKDKKSSFESAFQQIIIEHKMEAEIEMVCKCGKTKIKKVCLSFNLYD